MVQSVGRNFRHRGIRKGVCFFYLPYWKDLPVRHVLDVMHIEKNVCEAILGTLLNIPGKTKDSKEVRDGMVTMGIRPELHPQSRGSGRV